MSNLVAIPALSAVLTMEEFPEGSPLAGSRVSAAAVSTAVEAEAFTAAEATAEVTGNSVRS